MGTTLGTGIAVVAHRRSTEDQPYESPSDAAPAVTSAYGVVVRKVVQVVGELNTQIIALEAELTRAFEQHADAEIVTTLTDIQVLHTIISI